MKKSEAVTFGNTGETCLNRRTWFADFWPV